MHPNRLLDRLLSSYAVMCRHSMFSCYSCIDSIDLCSMLSRTPPADAGCDLTDAPAAA
eukprot:COSAG01_NODE_31857_length_590_cov_0.991853_1_plen_57_part_01